MSSNCLVRRPDFENLDDLSKAQDKIKSTSIFVSPIQNLIETC
jgi:hypothetical protein